MKASSSSVSPPRSQGQDGEQRCLNSELWHACAGPLVSLPTIGSRVVYLPQGHSEQVAASTNKEVDGHIPNYPSLPPQLICQLHNVTMHADVETDEVYAQMTLQPLSTQEQKETYIPPDMGIASKQPTNYFCKTLTASDTSTHGGFSVPRRAAEKVFPPLDFTQQPPAQELIARDLHDVEWKFRHIFRGQPKRHLLTTGWSVFVSAKRLVAGDSVLFIWNEKNQLLLGIRRANRPQTVMPSSVLSSDSMHIGLLAAAAHAAATNSRFTVFYNPRASPSEFVIPLSKYVKAVYHTRVSVGMRFRMLFETEESSVRRYMGTITGISDLDSVRWPNSHWRSVKVGWDESTAGERQPRVSLWEIEPLTTFPMYPSLFPLRLKRPWHPGLPSFQDSRDGDSNGFMWLRGEPGDRNLRAMNFQSLGMGPWLQQRFDPLSMAHEQDHYQAMAATALQEIRASDSFKQPFIQFQQPFQFPQQFPRQSNQWFPPQVLSQPQEHQTLNESLSGIHLLQQQQQFVSSFDDKHKQQVQLQQNYLENTYQIPTEQIQQQQSSRMSSSVSQKPPVFPDSNMTAATVLTATNAQGVMGSLGGGSSGLINFSRISQPVVHELQHQQQTWIPPKFGMTSASAVGNVVSLLPFPGKDGALNTTQNCAADVQAHTLFGVNIDSSSSLIPNQAPNLVGAVIENEESSLPFADSAYQNSLGNGVNDPTTLLQNGSQSDVANGNFVKVHKSGSVGRWLDISRFSSYHQLREELGQMFGIEGQLEDPLRSGWQLVFVDRENDVLLLGDDPWGSFVNNVSYIKILSPEDVQKLGQQEYESLNPSGGSSLNGETRNHHYPSGLHSVSSLETRNHLSF